MKGTFYCHSVQSQDDGRTQSYMTSESPRGKPPVEIHVIAPFEAFEPGEAPRAWYRYKVTIERVEE